MFLYKIKTITDKSFIIQKKLVRGLHSSIVKALAHLFIHLQENQAHHRHLLHHELRENASLSICLINRFAF